METDLKKTISTTVNLVFEKHDANNSRFFKSKEINKFFKGPLHNRTVDSLPNIKKYTARYFEMF